MEVKGLNKLLYKIEIILLKFIPFILATFNFIHTILWILGIGCPILVDIAGISLLSLLFLYLSSFVFKFCIYHRLPLYYIMVNDSINILDYTFNFNIADYHWIIIHSVLFGLFTIICGILKLLKHET